MEIRRDNDFVHLEYFHYLPQCRVRVLYATFFHVSATNENIFNGQSYRPVLLFFSYTYVHKGIGNESRGGSTSSRNNIEFAIVYSSL